MSAEPSDLIYYVLLLVLPLSALAARRLPWRTVAWMAAAWIGIFGIAILVVGERDRFAGAQAYGRHLLYGDEQAVAGTTTRIPMGPDGHFWAMVTINGVQRRMLVDSGATTIAITEATARAAGIEPDSVFPVMIGTANGQITAHTGTAKSLAIGGIEARDIGVVISPAFEDDAVGMNLLSRLASWKVEGRTLVLTP